MGYIQKHYHFIKVQTNKLNKYGLLKIACYTKYWMKVNPDIGRLFVSEEKKFHFSENAL